MKPDATNLPASVRDRLNNIARQQNRPFQELLQYYAIERFLYRLALSPHSSEFLLKGALVFYCRSGELARPTRDIDLEGFTANTIENLIRVVGDVCTQTVEPDGMRYDTSSIRGETIRQVAERQGTRLRFMASLGSARVPMQVDVGFSDEVTPAATVIEYPAILNMPAPRLRAYPYETTIAEKLQAMIALGSVNTRLKDFYDLWILARQAEFEGATLLKAVQATFRNRNTLIPTNAPSGLSDDFARDKQQQWQTFVRRIDRGSTTPRELGEVISLIRVFVYPLLRAAAEGVAFQKQWPAGGPWK